MQPPGMTDKVFVDLQENCCLQHPKCIHQCDQLCKTCSQEILTMGGLKMVEALPTPTTQTGRVHLDKLTNVRFDYESVQRKG